MFEAGEGAVGEAQQELIDTANDEYSEIETPQTTITLHFDEMGNPADDGVYQVTLFMTCEVRAVGNMITGNMDIVHVDQPEENLAQLDTAIYFPDDVDAVLSTDEAIDFESIARTETEAMTEEGSVFPAQEEQTADSDQTEAAS
jgi:hypothetical protein